MFTGCHLGNTNCSRASLAAAWTTPFALVFHLLLFGRHQLLPCFAGNYFCDAECSSSRSLQLPKDCFGSGTAPCFFLICLVILGGVAQPSYPENPAIQRPSPPKTRNIKNTCDNKGKTHSNTKNIKNTCENNYFLSLQRKSTHFHRYF